MYEHVLEPLSVPRYLFSLQSKTLAYLEWESSIKYLGENQIETFTLMYTHVHTETHTCMHTNTHTYLKTHRRS